MKRDGSNKPTNLSVPHGEFNLSVKEIRSIREPKENEKDFMLSAKITPQFSPLDD